MAQQNKSNSLTEGSVARGMLLFAIPIFISNLFQQLYNAADSLIVGNFLGGEAQRLKLASEMGKAQSDSLFVFDEPTIGLHPADVQVLLGVFQTLIEHGATVIVIEHDLDVIRNADYIIDMGPGGGAQGGTVVAAGTPDVIRHTPASQTGKFI